eukprot:13304432-Alexandrium_andersonii.AAC.1
MSEGASRRSCCAECAWRGASGRPCAVAPRYKLSGQREEASADDLLHPPRRPGAAGRQANPS